MIDLKQYRKQRKELSPWVADLCEKFANKKWVATVPGRPRAKASDFKAVEPLMNHDLINDPLRDVVTLNAWLTDLRKDLNVGFVLPPEPDHGADHDYFSLMGYKSVSVKQSRGKVIRPMPVMIELTMGWLRHSGGAIDGSKVIFGRTGIGRWVALSHGALLELPDFDDRVKIVIGLQLLQETQWRVGFSLGEGPEVQIPTDPIGAREVFKFRDIPEGRKRRAALVHWVDEHWRQIRVDPEEETKVRAHLRGMSKGTNSFVWNGLRCTIRPSHIDHELEEIERENRKYLTEIGAARRIAGEDVHAQLPWWLRAWRRLKGKR